MIPFTRRRVSSGTRSVKPVIDTKPNGEKQIVLNFITPHQKWGIHSTYTDNLIMLTLSRGGPIVWISALSPSPKGPAWKMAPTVP